ncbi:hypothetical protein [Stenomitos frigidus]|uniref:Uncharacterized protein n=1 Tax=Stenomitos frigidus ULC18 TaxID=2107698 RepID=A0A2T1DVB8_9CYAN|nr:hypothetical protein [Stenomitos frigidus]PSB24324.1 hypothetical protein C7B82_27340 [Stenomitos frigidus ULC18]
MSQKPSEASSVSEATLTEDALRRSRVASEDSFLDSDDSLSPLFPQTKRKGGLSKWVWFGVAVSVGLHGLLLLLPTGDEPMPVPPKDPEKQVRITQLPKLIKAAPSVKKVTKLLVKPVVRSTTVPPIPQPKTPLRRAAAGSPDAGGSSAWDDFPIYPGAQPGCFNLSSCQQTADGVKSVADYYAKALPAKKYTVKPTVQLTDREVFQISRNRQMQFLSIIQTEKGSVYVLSDAPRSLEDLKKAVEVPPEVSEILSNLEAQNADPSNFEQPKFFYTEATGKGISAGALVTKPGIRNISLIAGYSFDTMMDEFFRNNLQQNDFEVSDPLPDFGGGKVYEVTRARDKLKLYLNLVPTKDKAGALIVTWKDPPK